MGLRKIFKGQVERREYVRHLMNLSSMPEKERNRWEKMVPSMTEVELSQFQGILEKEISELADIYLKVFQRRAESRVADLGVEYGEEALDMNTDTVEKFFSVAPKIDESMFDVAEDPAERTKESNILQFLVENANFIDTKNKEIMVEKIQQLPMIVIKDLQAVVIREGLRALKKKQFHKVAKLAMVWPKRITEALFR